MDSFPFGIPPFPGRPLRGVDYPVGTIFPWYAADNKRDMKQARFNPPDGWEYTGLKVKLKPNTLYNRSKTGVKYVLYLRKV